MRKWKLLDLLYQLRRNGSGSFATLAAIRHASSREVSFGVPGSRKLSTQRKIDHRTATITSTVMTTTQIGVSSTVRPLGGSRLFRQR
jgi:hypothetical protein